MINAILDYYGVDTLEELLNKYGWELQDSIVPCFCTACHEEVQDGEPDLRNMDCPICGESGTVNSVVEILMEYL